MGPPAGRMVVKEGWAHRRYLGLALLLGALVLWYRVSKGEGGTPEAVAAPIAASVGALLLVYTKDVVIDRRARTLTARWGLLVPLGGRAVPLETAQVVAIARESRHAGEGGDTIVYPVRIECRDGPVAVAEPRTYQEARRKAEEIARFIGLGVTDSSAGPPVLREAGTLDDSLGERLRREGVKPTVPVAPPGLRSRLTTSAGGATIELAWRGFGISNVLAAAFGLAIIVGLGCGAAVVLGRGGPIDVAWLARMCLFMGIPGLALGLWIIRRAAVAALRREWVMVGPHGITHRAGSRLGMTTTLIPADELTDLLIGQPEVRTSYWMKDLILARSSRMTMEIGSGLDRRELEWVLAVIRSLIAVVEPRLPPATTRAGPQQGPGTRRGSERHLSR